MTLDDSLNASLLLERVDVLREIAQQLPVVFQCLDEFVRHGRLELARENLLKFLVVNTRFLLFLLCKLSINGESKSLILQ